MAVPDTNTFSLDDVRVEMGLGAASSLQDCFDNANPGFDPTYEGSKDRLSNFRNYDHTCVSVTAYGSNGGTGTSALACADAVVTTFYHDGGGTYPTNGDTVYTDAYGCTTLNGGNNWYRDTGGVNAYQISSVGVVSNSTAC